MATKEEIIAFLQQDFPQFDNIIESVSESSAVIRRKVTEADLRPGGTVSGPTLFAVADSALYVAVLGAVGIIPLAVTTNISMNFMRRPSPDADIIGKCTLLKVGRTLVVGEVALYSDGDDAPIAHAVGTYAIPPKR